MEDALGHPITAGCTVLTARYWSPTMSTTAKVKRVTKARVILDTQKTRWIDGEWATEEEEIARKPHQVVVIDVQVMHNRRKFPENFV